MTKLAPLRGLFLRQCLADDPGVAPKGLTAAAFSTCDLDLDAQPNHPPHLSNFLIYIDILFT